MAKGDSSINNARASLEAVVGICRELLADKDGPASAALKHVVDLAHTAEHRLQAAADTVATSAPGPAVIGSAASTALETIQRAVHAAAQVADAAAELDARHGVSRAAAQRITTAASSAHAHTTAFMAAQATRVNDWRATGAHATQHGLDVAAGALLEVAIVADGMTRNRVPFVLSAPAGVLAAAAREVATSIVAFRGAPLLELPLVAMHQSLRLASVAVHGLRSAVRAATPSPVLFVVDALVGAATAALSAVGSLVGLAFDSSSAAHAAHHHPATAGRHRGKASAAAAPSLTSRATALVLSSADSLATAAARTAGGLDATLGVTPKAEALGVPALATSAVQAGRELAHSVAQWTLVSSALSTAASTDAWLLGGRGAAAVTMAQGPGLAYVSGLAQRYAEARNTRAKNSKAE